MTTTTNGHPLATTDSGDVRMRVRAPENPPQAPDRAGSTSEFAHVRAIPDKPSKVKTDEPGKIRNFVQLHGGEAQAAIKDGWFLTERPDSLQTVAATVFPAKGHTSGALHWTGLVLAHTFRLACHGLAYLICAATRTDKRAAVALALTVLTFTTVLAATALAGR